MNKDELKKKLDPKNVKSRPKGDVNLSYMEAWKTIEEANAIFDFDGWSRETVYNREVSRYEYNGKQKVGYEAKVVVTVGDVRREGTGHGCQVAKDLFDAIEGAAKEAETDAMKRALMTFGNRFGLALYDKTQANVGVEEEPIDVATKLMNAINASKDAEYLGKLEKSKKVVDARAKLPDDLKVKVIECIAAKLATFTQSPSGL